ncbi:PP2C family protein-serine/threonine phosphatase [Arthrobacter mobilis]|uniref:Serine/threonine-protein phosphatase n=1 Tax=Arthrobacter mobilis TaxID=2724944 RepID=A0A7X6HFL5_9MICC|nr:protein phosphatase 2C domain-containing protein [Arthrobacter mobilis]NKX55470.1 serine/threonine-protein phosphatase [Arthrobacter mobilis]
MALILRYAARSDVGKARSKNDDSAYAGTYLAVVADGMGGHAGGDVASASTVLDLVHLDRVGHEDPANVLADEIQAANSILSDLVKTSPMLAGMGTTVTALLLHDNVLEFAHIGDSRAYRLKNGVFEQVSKDHTFVQRLIDEGRLRPEEAAVHPHRNVLMRVLGDVDASPELDLATHPAEAGERWLLCSDGLDAVVPDHVIGQVLRSAGSLQDVVDKLVQLTLDGGAPDNVTVVAVEVAESGTEPVTAPVGLAAAPAAASASAPAAATMSTVDDPASDPVPAGSGDGDQFRAAAIRSDLALRPHVLVGAAALATETGQIPIVAKRSNERRAAALLTHRAPDQEPDETAAEQEAAPRRRRWLIPAFLSTIALLLAAVMWFGYLWTQTQYYVSQVDGRVAIFNGVSQNLGPIQLSHVDTVYNIPLQNLPAYTQQRLQSGVAARDLGHAEQIVEELRISSQICPPAPVPGTPATASGTAAAGGTAAATPTATPTAKPTATPTTSAAPTATATGSVPAATGQPDPALPPECLGGSNE